MKFDGTGSSPSQGADTLTFTYDALGRPHEVKRASTVLTAHAWSPEGTLASRQDGPTASPSSFTFDWAGRLVGTTSPLWTRSVIQSWRHDGLLARSWLAGGLG